MSYYTYIARCNDNTLYTGYCVNISQREKAHNEGKGAKYTRPRTPVKIVYSEKFKTKSDAMKREFEIKQWTKAKKESIIK
jgi:putative endonuclease